MADTASPSRRRPILVWVIFLFYLVSCVLVIAQMFVVTAGGMDMSPEQQAMLARFTVFDRVIGYIDACLTLVGVTLLLGLRRRAVTVLALAFATNLFSTAVVWLRINPFTMVSSQGLIAQAAGIVLFGAVVFYAWRLEKRGVLSAATSVDTTPRK